ncbi:MAG: hypothetical protein J6U92_04110 [Clostridia bacterium]|nr:hypothetical protein [Clostridia bacterium]
MTERFFWLINWINGALGGGWLLIISLSIIFLTFIVVFIQALIVREYSFSKRCWFALFCGAICLAQSVFTPTEERIFVVFSLAVSLLLCSLLFSIRVRGKVGKEHKKLIDFIDGQIRRSGAVPQTPTKTKLDGLDVLDKPLIKEEKESAKIEQPHSQKSKQQKDLDFTHVKSVISKLSYYGLSQNDKRQVQDLETALYQAEQGEDIPGLKSRINDGLGALLKIMSKYGI